MSARVSTRQHINVTTNRWNQRDADNIVWCVRARARVDARRPHAVQVPDASRSRQQAVTDNVTETYTRPQAKASRALRLPRPPLLPM